MKYTANDEFIENSKKIFTNIKMLEQELLIDKKYHFRVHNLSTYIFFGDLDNYKNNIQQFIKILQDFLLKYYNLSFDESEFKYTVNDIKQGSYHYSIPKWNASTEKIK